MIFKLQYFWEQDWGGKNKQIKEKITLLCTSFHLLQMLHKGLVVTQGVCDFLQRRWG